MTVSSLSTKERSLVQAAIAFANLSSIESNRQVEDLFGIETGRVDEHSQLYRDTTQPQLRRWLSQGVIGNGGRAQTAAEIGRLMPQGITAAPVFSEGRLAYDFRLSGVEAGCILALALILDQERGLAGRLQQCTLSWCGKFNVDFDGFARPRARKYCSANHRMLANYELSPERMRQWRKAA